MNLKNMTYNLDCASMMLVLGRNEERTYNIRLSVMLYEKIEENVLEEAFRKTIQKYPFFFVRFINHKNSFIAEIEKDVQKIIEKKNLSNLNFQDDCQGCESMVSYRDKTIIFEYSHAVSDGMGGIEFLLNLALEYLSIKYKDETILANINPMPIHKQLEDGYKIHANGFQLEKGIGRVYKIKGTPELNSIINVSSYYLSIEDIKELAKKYQVSLNDLVTGFLFMTLLKLQRDISSNKLEKIMLSIPVNLRTRFNFDTMRNFTFSVSPEIKPTKDIMELSEICMKIHKYIKKSTDIEYLAGICGAAIKAHESSILKILPLSIKKKIVQFSLNLQSEGTMTFSNLGIISLPIGMEKYISDFEFLFSTKPGAPYGCSMFTFNDIMKITFIRSIKEPLMEAQFEKVLQEAGIDYKN